MRAWAIAALGLGWGALAAAQASPAEPPRARMTVIASGDCRDPDLISDLRLLSKELQSRLPGQFVDEASFRDHLAPRATQTLDDLGRQLDAAQTLYYQALYPRADEQTRAVLKELERSAPGPERVELAVRAQVLEGVIQRGLGHPDEGDESFREVIRLAPRHQLDPELFSPSTRGRFEKVRRDLLAEKKVHLEVTSAPAGATVFLDGAEVGKTPFAGNLPPGPYRLLLARDDAWSLPHPVDLTHPVTVHVDLQFEGAIHPDRIPCITTRGDERSRLAMASRLGTLVEVDEVVVLRLDRLTAGPSWLAATVTSVGSGKIREGGLKVPDPAVAPEGLGELANFVVTGKAGKQVLTVEVPAASPGLAPARPGMLPDHSAPAAAVERRAPASPGTFRTPLGLGIGGVGVLAAAAAVVAELQASAAWNTFNAIYRVQGPPSLGTTSFTDAAQAKHTAQVDQTVALVSGIVGVAGLATGATLVVLDLGHPTSGGSAQLSVGPGTLGLAGTFGP